MELSRRSLLTGFLVTAVAASTPELLQAALPQPAPTPKIFIPREPSPFHRVNVQRLFQVIRETLEGHIEDTLHLDNDSDWRAHTRDYMGRICQSMQDRRAIYGYGVECSSIYNSPEIIDSGGRFAMVMFQPFKSTEYCVVGAGHDPANLGFVNRIIHGFG